jgi:beta-lactam-binding protein with PASTA domain
MRTTLVPLVIALALAPSACGESEDQPTAATSSGGDAQALQDRVEKLESEAEKREAEAARKLEAAERKARAAERKARKAKRQARRRAKAREAAAKAEAETVAAGSGGGGIVVPDVTGLDHQAAQDVMQGEGLWLLDEVDCTGQDRMLLWDRNWEVVSTDPPAGTRVSEDDTITLCSKKQGE